MEFSVGAQGAGHLIEFEYSVTRIEYIWYSDIVIKNISFHEFNFKHRLEISFWTIIKKDYSVVTYKMD